MNQEILRCIPVFLKSSKGKEALSILLDEFNISHRLRSIPNFTWKYGHAVFFSSWF